MGKTMDELISEAIWICKDYDTVSSALFQRSLSLDYEIADKIFLELEKIGLITNVVIDDDSENPNRIGFVNIEKLEELTTN
jgi:hypothetical protein